MANCEKCGMKLPEGNHYCPNCGAITDTSPDAQLARQQQCPAKGSRYAPLGSWAYFGALVLMGVPVVGLIFTIVWACGGANRINLIHLARAMLLLYALLIIALIVVSVLFGSTFYYYADIFTNY